MKLGNGLQVGEEKQKSRTPLKDFNFPIILLILFSRDLSNSSALISSTAWDHRMER